MIVGCILILPIIFGALSISKINSATEKSELVGLGICTLLFCSLLGGIFMLCIPDSELKPKAEYQTNVQNNTYIQNSTSEQNSTSAQNSKQEKSEVETVAERLTKLKNLKDTGTISDEEYERMRKDILNKF